MSYRKRETKPRKRAKGLDKHIRLLAKIILEVAGMEIPSDISLYATNQNRGWYVHSKRYISIPRWVIENKKTGYDFYYIAHELAHAWVFENVGRNVQSHGPEFMEAFKMICPKEYWHYELGYKPRNAKAAGISKPKG